MNTLKYFAAYSLPLTFWIALTNYGAWSYLPVIYAFGLIPFMEIFLPPDTRNLEKVQEELHKNDPVYDWILYLIVPTQYLFLGWFLTTLAGTTLLLYEKLGLTMSMGVLCGSLGINVAHELGHRSTSHERFLAKALLLTSLYMHFIIEHNRGHHKNVSTPDDPSSARLGEAVYTFWIRSILWGYRSAWKIETKRLEKKAVPFWSFRNEMLRFQAIQLGLLVVIYAGFGGQVLLWYLLAALMGILLLETVNYIEHYGLVREKTSSGHYERTRPVHSWNSNHILGRLMLFELSRHSDHHYLASRKYQILRHHEESPQMPTGYPGMMLLSLIPPLWFYIMNNKIKISRGRLSPILKDD
ncbi:alkane 1-monooxygenase [Rapidithrix thailandica]|uniref:Alkane 1-monooxygenase n=1 Tax=Rapidithrix thailandica TaxID=413964 RepID=A0AAW9S2R7_9BACT